jgi:hypothetical protein
MDRSLKLQDFLSDGKVVSTVKLSYDSISKWHS